MSKNTKLVNKFAWTFNQPDIYNLAFGHTTTSSRSVHVYPDNTRYKEIMNCNLQEGKASSWTPIQLTKSQYLQLVLDGFELNKSRKYPEEDRWKKLHKTTWEEFNEKTGLSI